jgi:DNA-binding transcriptional regulator YiaG
MEERFWSKVDKTESCWLWTAYRNPEGYGRFGVNGKIKKAHHVSWLLTNHTIPEGNVIRHKCRNKHCVNPEHLETGTVAENNADMIRDGTSLRGIKNPTAKLTEEQVRQIRARAAENQQVLAEEYGVCSETISKIILRKRWAHLQ